MEVFVINLPSETKRRTFQEKQLQKLGLGYTILIATSADDIDDKIIRKHYYDWQRPLGAAEIACYFSHRNIWQTVIAGNHPALILEDDVLLSKNTPEILAELGECIDIDLVNLEVFAKKKYVAKTGETLIHSHKLFKLYLGGAGAGAYVIYPSGAKKLLEYEYQKGISPADAHIPGCYTLKSFQIEPAIAVQLVFYEYYNLGGEYKKLVGSSSTHNSIRKRTWIFGIKRTIAQVKLGIRKLMLMTKSHKRFIELRRQDFLR